MSVLSSAQIWDPCGRCCCVFWCFGCTQCQMQREMLKMREDKHEVLADKKQIYLLEPDVVSSMGDDGAKDK